MAYYMEEMTVKDMEMALKKTNTVIIPVGVVEQHGYHLPLSTDILNSVQLTRYANDKIDAVVAPAVPYCFSGGELPGTINISPNTFGLLISDISMELIRMGFKNIVVLLGHAGTDNKQALVSSLQMLQRRNQKLTEDITLSLVECWNLSQTWLNAFAMEPEHDFHAGMIETSLMMYWKPELVRTEIEMDDEYVSKMMRTDQDWFEKKIKLIDSPFIVEKVSQKEEIKVGVMGFPERASRELGEKVCNEMIESLAKYLNCLKKDN